MISRVSNTRQIIGISLFQEVSATGKVAWEVDGCNPRGSCGHFRD